MYLTATYTAENGDLPERWGLLDLSATYTAENF